MGSLHENNPSLWVATSDAPEFPVLSGGITTDVAIIGAGITGLTAAALLIRGGVSVAVIEAGRVVSGVTGYTTAKVTSLHALTYADLARRFDERRARLYGEANQAAIEQVAELVDDGGIDCDFERRAAYTYTEAEEHVRAIESEVEIATRLGLPAHFTTETDLPFPIRAAVRFDGQAQFHPRKYCLGLADGVVRGGGQVFEHTRALQVTDGRPCVVQTDRGTVHANHVIVASHLPFINTGGYFARCAPYRSYALAVRIERPPEGMYISVEEPVRSLRSTPGGLAIVGGQGHKAGQDPDTRRNYDALENWAQERYGTAEVVHRWSAQDYVTLDKIPYVGLLSHRSERLYVATGYRKWGMSNGTAAAMILTDRILERDNPWCEAFDSSRRAPIVSMKGFVSENLNVAKRFVVDRVSSMRPPSVDELRPGEAGSPRPRVRDWRLTATTRETCTWCHAHARTSAARSHSTPPSCRGTVRAMAPVSTSMAT